MELNLFERYHIMKRQSGMINLQGQLLQEFAFYNPPFCYLSTSINKTINEIEGEFFIANNGIITNIYKQINTTIVSKWIKLLIILFIQKFISLIKRV